MRLHKKAFAAISSTATPFQDTQQPWMVQANRLMLGLRVHPTLALLQETKHEQGQQQYIGLHLVFALLVYGHNKESEGCSGWKDLNYGQRPLVYEDQQFFATALAFCMTHLFLLLQYDLMVTNGANQAFVNIVLALCDSSDKVVLFTPYYFNHMMALQMTGGAPKVCR